MSKITTIGLDIAKNVFHAMCCDAQGKVVKKRMLRRQQVFLVTPLCGVTRQYYQSEGNYNAMYIYSWCEV